jgi:hypothetical protein
MKAAMTAPRAVVAPPKPAPPSIDEATVNRALADVSTESIHDFTVRVQPLLMNYCATAGCHGPKPKSDFHLERVYLNELNDSRLVRRNLYSTLKQINAKNPSTSKLLTVPLTAHGGGKTALFHAHNAEHYRQLAVWVSKVASAATVAPAAPTTAATTTGTDPLLQRLPIAPPGAPAPSPAPSATELQPAPRSQAASSSSPGSTSATEAAATSPSAPGSIPSPPAGAVLTPADRPAVDPFDPEIFNRRNGEAKP